MADPPRTSGSLPAELTSFVGRRGELTDVKRLLSTTRLVTLTGMGGVGKTRLALRVAAEIRRAFPDGVWFVPLDELHDPESLPVTVADVLGMGENAATCAVGGLADYLEHKRLLLVLDNCEHLVSACASLTGKLLSATTGLRVLTTSRQVLHTEGERVLPVLPLAAPERGENGHREAVTLFADRAAAVVHGFEIDAANREKVDRICGRLDGIPLAIELAAVRLQVLSLDQILSRLDERFRLLTTGRRTAQPRHRTLEAAVTWSFALCTRAEQRVWAAVSIFPDGFDLEAAEAVCAGDGIERDSVLDLVAGMVDKSILARRSGTYGRTAWYRMLETVREYGRGKLAESGREETVRARHVAYCVALTRRYRENWFGPRQFEWAERLGREHEGLRLALAYCLTHPDLARNATEIASGLWSYFYASGRALEGHRWLAKALSFDTAPTRARAEALQHCALLAAQIGELEPARRMLDETRVLAEKFGDDALRAGYARGRSMVSFATGDLAGARTLLHEALAGYRSAGDLPQIFTTLLLLAALAFFVDEELPTAAPYSSDALGLSEEHGAGWSKTYARWALAVQEWRWGDARRASALLREATATPAADRAQLAYAFEAMAWCAGAQGRHERAAGLLGAAKSAWRHSGAPAEETSPYAAFDERCAARARAELGAEAFVKAYGAMVRASLDEAIAFALDEKRSPVRPRPQGRRAGRPGELTRREREIAELVADGLSNREIAARLVIAQRTAETHVENILAKLGFTSRAQIAAWLGERRALAT
ncbi:ATP-binding protein [Amycolatopsis pigmentata]|uniref:ATP-binding protein n=1 Tax=Amycolatopsis pigmentata TaxID=450801 RepID=A0ABW5G8L7_9PSEU